MKKVNILIWYSRVSRSIITVFAFLPFGMSWGNDKSVDGFGEFAKPLLTGYKEYSGYVFTTVSNVVIDTERILIFM